MAIAAHAGAQPKSAPTLSDDVSSEARELYRLSRERFAAGDYARAADILQKAYRIAPAPELLYNLGQTYRLEGKCTLALEAYERCLASNTTTELRQRTEARIAEIRPCPSLPSSASLPTPSSDDGESVTPLLPADANTDSMSTTASEQLSTAGPRAPTVASFPTPEGATVREDVAAPARRTSTRRGERPAVWVTGVATAALAGLSGYWAWRSASASDDMSAKSRPGQSWDEDAQHTERVGRTSARLATISGVGALVCGGTFTWLLVFD